MLCWPGAVTLRVHPRKALFRRGERVLGTHRVQGDERDAIILSVGVAKRANGIVSRTGFGPLNREDGRRRLNVAVTRAKRRMTVISSFGPHDLAPDDRPTGTEMLRR